LRARPAVVVASKKAALVASSDLRDKLGDDRAFTVDIFPKIHAVAEPPDAEAKFAFSAWICLQDSFLLEREHFGADRSCRHI
jgi:hypothetical protein